MTRVGNSDTLAYDSHRDKNGNTAILGETNENWIFLFLAAGPCAYTPIFVTLVTLENMSQFLPFQVVVGERPQGCSPRDFLKIDSQAWEILLVLLLKQRLICPSLLSSFPFINYQGTNTMPGQGGGKAE